VQREIQVAHQNCWYHGDGTAGQTTEPHQWGRTRRALGNGLKSAVMRLDNCITHECLARIKDKEDLEYSTPEEL